MNVPGGVAERIIMQDGATATGVGTAIDCNSTETGAKTVVGMQVTGITTATITFQGTIDGTNWEAVQVTNLNDGSEGTTATADGLYRLTCIGLTQVRANITAWTTGTITVTGVACA